MTKDQSTFEEMLLWLRERGANHVKVQIANSSTARGLQFVDPVADGSVMFRVPTSVCILSSRVVSEFPWIRDAVAFAFSSEERDVLAIATYVLYLRQHPDLAREWRSYFQLVPRNFHLPVNYTTDELAAAKGSITLLRMVKNQWNLVKTLHHTLRNSTVLKDFSELLFEDVVWAYSLAQSRGFNIFVDKQSDETDFALIPLADMMNHDSAATADIRMDIEGSEVVVTAKGAYLQGAHFLGRYVKANSSMASWLASYGFVNQKSMYQGLRIEVDHLMRIAEFSEPHQAQLKHMLESVGCEASGWKHTPFALTVDGFTPGYLLCMRLALLSPEDYRAVVNKERTINLHAMVSKENELRTVSTITGHLRRLISQYPSTLAEDAKALERLKEAENVNINMQNIIQLRQQETALYFEGLRLLESLASVASINKADL